jgi:hypothetical protein
VPIPDDAKFTLSGFARTKAISSATVRTGNRFGLIEITWGTVAIEVIGTKSFSMS